MVGQAECHSVFEKWFETKAWHTEESTIALVLDGFLKRKISAASEKFQDTGPFTKPLVKRVAEKIPHFRTQLCGRMTFQQLTQALNRFAHETSLCVFRRAYNDLPTTEHQYFIIENLDLIPDDVRLTLKNQASQIIRRIQSELVTARSISDIENDLSKGEFTHETDFWFHLHCLKKLHETLKENSIKLNALPLKNIYIDYMQTIENITFAHEDSQQTLKLKKRSLRSNLLILPPQIGRLTGLRALFLDQNKLTFLPPQIGALIYLEQLSIVNNNLTYLPQTFQNLTNLRQLTLRRNYISDLPEGFRKLTRLEFLDLSVNNLSKIPEAIDSLQALYRLSLSGNPLTSVRLNASKLERLVYLGLKKIRVTPIENRQIERLKRNKCIINGGFVKPLIEVLPPHLFLLLLTFMPWQSLHVIAGINKYFHQFTQSFIKMREGISQQLFASSFQEIDEAERNFLTRHLAQTQGEISIAITQILQRIEVICTIIQDDMKSFVDFDEDGNEIEYTVYSIEKIKGWLSYYYFENDQEAFLKHLEQFLRFVENISDALKSQNSRLSFKKAFEAYEYCLNDILSKRRSSKSFSCIDSALVLLPPDLSRFRNIKRITLIELYLSSLPDDLRNLPHLTHIYLNENMFGEIPSVLLHCRHLETIALSDNFITRIPEDIANLKSLEILALHNNQISVVPDALSRLSNLRKLILTKNPIRVLPGSIVHLSSLIDVRINLEWDALSTPEKLWLLRQSRQYLKVSGIPIPAHLTQIPAILESIQDSLQETHGFKTLADIEANFSPEAFGDHLDDFLHYLQAFARSVTLSNKRLPQKKKRPINSTKVSCAYKAHRLCAKTIDINNLDENPHFILRGTFNTFNPLTFIPLKIREVRHVRYMDLQNNRLTYIDEEIWRLPLLETLKLDWNQLTELPDGINQSTHLEVLSLSHNPLYKLPNGIENTNIKRLKLGHTIIAWKSMPRTQKRWLRQSINARITTGISYSK